MFNETGVTLAQCYRWWTLIVSRTICSGVQHNRKCFKRLASLRHLETWFYRKMIGTRAFLGFLNAEWLKHILADSTTGTIWNSLYQQTNEQLASIGGRLLCLGYVIVAQLALPRFPSFSLSPTPLFPKRPSCPCLFL